MTIVLGLVLPHAPILLEPIGQADTEKAQYTLDAYGRAAASISAAGAEALVIIGPHGPQFSDAFTIHSGPLEGNFSNFNHPELALQFELHSELRQCLVSTARSQGLPLAALDHELSREFNFTHDLDHGVLVPVFLLHHLGVRLPVVVINPSRLSLVEHYRLGVVIRDVASTLDVRLAVIASGDLSHCITADAPYPYDPAGEQYDAAITMHLGYANVEGIVAMDERQLSQAAQCGHRPITTMLGALDGRSVSCNLLHYEAPFGVGYLVSALQPQGLAPSLLPSILEAFSARQQLKRQSEPPVVKLAREAVEAYVRQQRVISPPATPEFTQSSAAFVSLKLYGDLRGCIGTTSPSFANLGEEIVNMAVAACSKDPRFDPVDEWELADLDYSVDILSQPEEVTDIATLNPTLYGVIVQDGRRKGLLLPNLDGIDSVAEQLDIACRKAGIQMSAKTRISRFQVERYEGQTL